MKLKIIISHVNMDFDALASMIAAKKLYPDAQLVISDKQDDRVTRYLNIYRDMFDFVRDIHVDWAKVTTMILVDVAALRRVGRISKEFNEEQTHFIVYDHHPEHPDHVKHHEGIIEPVGATITLLIEEIQKHQLPISEFEATLFGLGLYTDTGNFMYKNTTSRDLDIASYLIKNGMNLDILQRFSEQNLEPAQQNLLDQLLQTSETHLIDGLEIAVSTYQLEKFQGGLALLTHKLLDIKGADAALSIVKMKNHVHVVGRASSERVTLLPLLKKLGGGGHQHAGSATVKNADQQEVVNDVLQNLPIMLKPATTAKDIMSHPVKTLTPETSIEEAGRLMYRYGHSGYPIIQDEQLVGLITRRDLDKGNHHGLGHAPVKAYMTTNPITVEKETTLEEIQKLIIEHNIGRLPVLEDGKMIGIVTRTNLIEVLHDEMTPPNEELPSHLTKLNLTDKMEEQLPKEGFALLKEISQTANRLDMPVYLIGGIVRDILLKKPNDDVDIVVEGNGILFAKGLQADYGGEVLVHDNFGTATWTHPTGQMIDITSSRLEYYDRPASLPDVELSTLEEDLHRRDFTINAMALRLNEEAFGELIDPFGGQDDLQAKQLKVLHNISFIEDPTRIFRAVRFEERFQFIMDEQTTKLALNSIDKVKALSPNRIVEEMKRLFKEGNPTSVIARLFDLNFWQQFDIPQDCKARSCQLSKELQRNYQNFYENQEPSWMNYFFIPFYLASKMDAFEKFALTKRDIKLHEEIVYISQYDAWDQMKKPGDFHVVLKEYSTEAILFLSATKKVDQALVHHYLVHRARLPHYFTGKDLMELGLQPGPLFSDLFLQLEMSQLNGQVTSKQEAKKWVEDFVTINDKNQ